MIRWEGQMGCLDVDRGNRIRQDMRSAGRRGAQPRASSFAAPLRPPTISPARAWTQTSRGLFTSLPRRTERDRSEAEGYEGP